MILKNLHLFITVLIEKGKVRWFYPKRGSPVKTSNSNCWHPGGQKRPPHFSLKSIKKSRYYRSLQKTTHNISQSSLHCSLYLAFKGEYNLSPWKLVLPSNILQVIFFAFYEFSNYPYNCPIASACKSGSSETAPRPVPPLQCNHDLAAWRWRRH